MIPKKQKKKWKTNLFGLKKKIEDREDNLYEFTPILMVQMTFLEKCLFPTWKEIIQTLQDKSLVTKLIVILGYNLFQYLFIKYEFWQIHHRTTYSSYLLHASKKFRKLKINSYIINKLFKF